MNGKLGIQKAFENQPGQCLDDKLALTFERTLDFAASRGADGPSDGSVFVSSATCL